MMLADRNPLSADDKRNLEVLLTRRETQTQTIEQIAADARKKFLSKSRKLIGKTRGAARK